MKALLTFLFVFAALNTAMSQAPVKVDNDKIKQATSDSSSKFYYPLLMARWKLLDNSLTEEDCRHLYYGYVFQPGYNGFADEQTALLNRLWEAKKTNEALDTALGIVQEMPVSLRANFNVVIAYYAADSTHPDFQNYLNRYKMLMAAVVSSGDGFTCETAIKTIKVSDEYEIIYRHFGIKKVGAQALVFPCDKLAVTPNADFAKSEIFFDTSASFNSFKFSDDGHQREKKRKKRKDKD